MQKLGQSIARQLAKLANGDIPYHRSHDQYMNGGWLGGTKETALLGSVSLNPLLSGSSNLCGSSGFWGVFQYSQNL